MTAAADFEASDRFRPQRMEPLTALRAFGRLIRNKEDTVQVFEIMRALTDALGEACVVAFSFAQTGNFGFAFIGWGAAREIRRENGAIPARRAVLQAWRHGRKARWLPALDYEALLAEPLDRARDRLNIRPPTVYDRVPAEARAALRLRA